MNEIKIIDFRNHTIRVIDDKWYVAKDITNILGIKNGNEYSKFFNQDQKKLIKLIDTTGRRNLFNCINKEAVIKVIGGCRKADENLINDLCKVLDITLQLIRIEKVETAYLQDVIDVLPSSIEYVREFKIGKYRIDLYLPKYKIAIECDEYGHKGYKDEEIREQFIRQQLDCKFVRFNPHEEGFSILHVIKTLLEEIFSHGSHK